MTRAERAEVLRDLALRARIRRDDIRALMRPDGMSEPSVLSVNAGSARLSERVTVAPRRARRERPRVLYASVADGTAVRDDRGTLVALAWTDVPPTRSVRATAKRERVRPVVVATPRADRAARERAIAGPVGYLE